MAAESSETQHLLEEVACELDEGKNTVEQSLMGEVRLWQWWHCGSGPSGSVGRIWLQRLHVTFGVRGVAPVVPVISYSACAEDWPRRPSSVLYCVSYRMVQCWDLYCSYCTRSTWLNWSKARVCRECSVGRPSDLPDAPITVCHERVSTAGLSSTQLRSHHRRAAALVNLHSLHPFPPIGDAACRQHAGGWPSHGHRQCAQKFGKDRACGSGDILADRHTETDMLITILRNRSRGRRNNYCMQ